MHRKRQLVWHFQLHGGRGRVPDPDYTDVLVKKGYEVESYALGGRGKLSLAFYFLVRIPMLFRCNLIITTDYITAFIIASLVRVLRLRTKQICIGMNISGRPLQFRSTSLNRWVNTTLQRIDLIVVASRAEIGIFENLHGIQPCRIVFAHWAFDLPHSESQMFTGLPHQYFCMIGRNNRDFETFCAAVSQVPARGVVIAMAPPDFEVPGNVQWFENLSMSDCIDCVRNAAANVVLVQDGERGAGHITIVMAMHCSKVNIVTDVATVGDYLVDGIHGYFVPLGSREEVACALRQVLDFPAETEAMGREAAKYAARWLSHSRRTERLRAILSAWVRSEHIDFEDPTWAMEHASLKTDQTSPCPHFSKKH